MSKKLLALVIVALLLIPFSNIMAQGEVPVFCGELSEADCDLVKESQTSMQDVTSFAADFEMNMALDGSGLGSELEGISFALIGDGVMAYDLSGMMDFYNLTPEAMENFPQIFVDFLRGVQAETGLEIILPVELVQAQDIPELKFDLIMLDGILYAEISSLTGAPEAFWMGFDLATFYEGIFEQFGDEMSGMDFSELFSSEMFTMFNDPEFLSRFMTITRLADEEMMGQSMAVFQIELDYGALFGDESFRGFMMDYMETTMSMMPDGEEFDMDMDQFVDMLAEIYSNMTFTMSEWIGLEDNYIHHASFAFVMDMDLAALAELGGEELPASAAEGSFGLTFDGSVDLSAFNEPVEITAPEDAQIIDPMMFMGSNF